METLIYINVCGNPLIVNLKKKTSVGNAKKNILNMHFEKVK